MISTILLTMGLFAQNKPFDPAKERVIAIVTPEAIYIFAGNGAALDWRATFPNSGPGPIPVPPKPIDLTGIAKVSFDQAKVVGNKAECLSLAKAQRGLASAIAAGGLSDPAVILDEWRKANRAAVDASRWQGWGVAMKREWEGLQSAGKLSTPKEYEATLKEIATGLEAAGNG